MTVNWPDERYVRIYCRDTVDLLAMGWEARAVLWEILRHCDRSGVIAIGKHGARGLAVVLQMPADVVERCLPVLVADGCVHLGERELLVPNFIPAQEAVRSDAARKRAERAAKKLASPPDGTSRQTDAVSRNERVDGPKSDAASRNVLDHESSPDAATQNVTPYRAVLHRAVPNHAVPAPTALVDRAQPEGLPKSEWLAYRQAFVDSYVTAVRNVTSVASWTMPPFGPRDLEQILANWCTGSARSDPEAWIGRTVQRFAESEPIGYEPSRLITWLNRQALESQAATDDDPPPRSGPPASEPMPPPRSEAEQAHMDAKAREFEAELFAISREKFIR